MLRILSAIAAASLLAAALTACQTTSLGADWGPNTREASRISVDGDDSFIVGREWKRRQSGTQERLRFDNGATLFYEEVYGDATAWAVKDEKESIRKTFDGTFTDANYRPGEIVLRPLNDYRLLHMSAQSDTQTCFLGEAMSHRGRGGWRFILTMCRPLRDPAVARLDADAIDIITRLRIASTATR